jgi:guanosine-diphosphatase
LTFGGHDYVLYQHSYLNYGLMEGRKRLKAASDGKLPCLKSGVSVDGILGDGKDFSTCKAFVSKSLFSKTDTCATAPCSFDGIHQPQLTTAFPVDKEGAGKLYAFSYFYDKTNPYDLKDKFTVGDIGTLGEAKCAASAIVDSKEEDDVHLCLDLGFIYSLLSVGYELPDGREMEVLKKIDGFETGWCLGSAIQLIDSLNGRGSSALCKA